MHIKILTFLLTVSCLISIQGKLLSQTAVQPAKDWTLLEDSIYSIEYPQDWELNQSGQMGTKFILLSKVSSSEDQFRENVNLFLQDISGYNLDLDQYVELTKNQIKTMITDGNLLVSERIEKDGTSFHKIIYTGKQGLYNLKFEQYFWLKDNKAYIVTLTCEEAQFDAYQEVGEKILNSFVFKK